MRSPRRRGRPVLQDRCQQGTIRAASETATPSKRWRRTFGYLVVTHAERRELSVFGGDGEGGFKEATGSPFDLGGVANGDRGRKRGRQARRSRRGGRWRTHHARGWAGRFPVGAGLTIRHQQRGMATRSRGCERGRQARCCDEQRRERQRHRSACSIRATAAIRLGEKVRPFIVF